MLACKFKATMQHQHRLDVWLQHMHHHAYAFLSVVASAFVSLPCWLDVACVSSVWLAYCGLMGRFALVLCIAVLCHRHPGH
jgi:hypothetical protein